LLNKFYQINEQFGYVDLVDYFGITVDLTQSRAFLGFSRKIYNWVIKKNPEFFDNATTSVRFYLLGKLIPTDDLEFFIEFFTKYSGAGDNVPGFLKLMTCAVVERKLSIFQYMVNQRVIDPRECYLLAVSDGFAQAVEWLRPSLRDEVLRDEVKIDYPRMSVYHIGQIREVWRLNRFLNAERKKLEKN
jgi:hypothetical protein